MSDSVLTLSGVLAGIFAVFYLFRWRFDQRDSAIALTFGPGRAGRARPDVWSRHSDADRPDTSPRHRVTHDAAGSVRAIDRDTAETYARWFQALSDPTRIVILSYLSRRGAPVSVGGIVNDLAIGQSTVSHHLKTLLAVGFVTCTRQGTARLYRVNHNCITQFPTAADVVMGRSPAVTPVPPPGPIAPMETE